LVALIRRRHQAIYFGVYHIGEDQARSCVLEGTSDIGVTPRAAASQVTHLGLGIASTLCFK
jgi:hypothetical protein